MLICVKCLKKQSRKSESVCPYDGNKKADPIHAWMDYEIFINELREKLPPFIRERIAILQNKNSNNQALFNERLNSYNKKIDELQAAYDVYLNEGLPHDIKKKKQRYLQPFLRDVILNGIGCVLGVFIAFKWILPLFGKITPSIILGVIITFVILIGIILGKYILNYIKAIRYANSNAFSDELSSEWFNSSGFSKIKSDIEAEKNKWNNISGSFKLRIEGANLALTGSNEDLLNFFNIDNEVKNWYLENIYEGAW